MTDTSSLMQVNEDTFKLTKAKGASMSTTSRKGSTMTVILEPHNSSFQTRTLELKDKAKVRIGRQTSSKTLPSAFNGYFDSKVLSRQHAEIWCERSSVFIKDVKSSNGTFVNGQRLSNECEESEPKELYHQDQVEFGIDIFGDNGSIMYYKVACTVHIFPMPLSQVDTDIIKELGNHHSAQSLIRKTSTSSINTTSELTVDNTGVGNGTGGAKKSRKLESILLKLQSELDKSKQVENELKTIRETVTDLDKIVLNQDKVKKSDELELKLDQAEATIRSFDKKYKHQNQAIQTAKQELHKLEKELENKCLEKKQLEQELMNERMRIKELQEQIQKGTNNKFWNAFQVN
ncbi:SMAD/FHA domain-containing protein [Gilbertella persicaria]|uniref:SMAD/FHA domain-containing protein n=1 Tax=Gilbertella persicaria TaxID=101096 RepID=UPI00221EBF70|nr:SMAD/FHA domain-containing protein [Gilbertella persicaria]KAI8081823.1 SMAD/FHA domain-containing protein [Gilbertella persicaria]